MEKISTEEVMGNLDMLQSRSGKIYEFAWWDLELISADVGSLFTSTEFKEKSQTHGVLLRLVAPEN